MNKWVFRIAGGFAVFVIALLCINVSDKYFNTVINADNKNIQQETDDINNWYDELEKKNETQEENKENNSAGEFAPNTGGGGSGQESDNPFKNFKNNYTDGYSVYKAAEEVFNKAKGISVEMKGTVLAVGPGVTQSMRAIRQKDALGKMYIQGVSNGMLDVGMEAYYDTRLFKYRKCDNVTDSLSGNFDKFTPVSTSVPAYEKMYGAMPDKMYYIVNENTLDHVENFKYENKLYTFDMYLKPAAAENYKYNVQNMAGASGPAEFTKIKLSVTIDSTGRFRKIIYEETYNVKINIVVNINSTCVTHLEENYKVIHGDVDIKKPW